MGKERFLKREFLRNFKKELFAASAGGDLHAAEFTAKKDNFAGFLDFCRTAPLFSEKRLAVLWDSEKLDAPDKKSLLEALDFFSPSGVIVFESEESNAKKDPFLRQLSEKTRTLFFHPVYERDLAAWLQARAKEKGGQLDRPAAEALVGRVGRDLASLTMALEELAVYVGPQKRILADDVRRLLGRPAQEDVFALLERIVNRDPAGALRIAAGLWREGAAPQEILAVLTGQWDRLRKVSVYAAGGRSGEFISSELRIHAYFLNQWLRQAEKMSPAEYSRGFEELLACDEGIKTGRADDRLAVERLLVKLCDRV